MSSLRRARLAVALLAAMSAAPVPEARAQDGGVPEDSLAAALSGEARALYEIGRSLFEAKDYAAALPKFQRAYELSADPRLLWNVAACEASLKHWARALTLVDRYVAAEGPRLSETDRTKTERFHTAAKQFVATVTVTAPAGAAVAVDGEPAGTTPLAGPLYLDAGKHRVVFTKPGHRGLVRLESVDGGADLAWTVTLDRLQIKPL